MVRKVKIKFEELNRLVHNYKKLYGIWCVNRNDIIDKLKKDTDIAEQILIELEELQMNMELIDTKGGTDEAWRESESKAGRSQGNSAGEIHEGE